MQLSGIKETCIYIADINRTKAFYFGLIGLEVVAIKTNEHIFFRVGNDMLLCFIASITKEKTNLPSHYANGKQHFAFECPQEEYDSWKQKLKDNLVEIEHEATWKDGLKSFYFRDPDGHSVEIIMPGIWD